MSDEDDLSPSALALPTNNQLSLRSASLVRRGLHDLHALEPRIVYFPPDRSMGKLFITNRTRKSWHWEELGEARGDIIVPAEYDLKLVVSKDAANDLSPLSALKRDDLYSLSLARTNIDDTALQHIQGMWLGVLDLSSTKTTNAGGVCLSEMWGLGMLRIDGTGISDVSSYLLMKPCLWFLDLSFTSIDDHALECVTKKKRMEVLYLSNTQVTDAGLAYLKELKRLRTLDLTNTLISDLGLKHLQALPALKKLKLSGTQVTEAAFESLKEVFPDWDLAEAEFYFFKGLNYSNQGEFELAISSYEKVIQIDENASVMWLYLGNAHADFNQYPKALNAYKRAVSIDPNYTQAHHNVGWAYNELGRYQEAIDAYKKAIEIDPKMARAYFGLGVVYENLGQSEDAIESYKVALLLNPFYIHPLNALLSIFSSLEQWDEVMSFCKHLISRMSSQANPTRYQSYFNAYYELAEIYRVVGLYDAALESYKKAVSIASENGWKDLLNKARFGSGMVCIDLKDEEAALREHRILSEADEQLADELLTWIHIYLRGSLVSFKSPPRVISFPRDCSIGWLYLLEAISKIVVLNLHHGTT
jgi:tetratricopeptide (TPR) repeat protein